MMNSEKGQALPLAILALAVGMLVIAPFLGYASSSLIGSRIYEQAISKQYSADAGVEYAIWHLQEGRALESPEFTINNKTVNVTIENQGEGIYKITSIAISDDGSSTTIESYVEISADYSYLFDNAITSPGDVTLKPGTEVYGDLQYNGELDNKGDIYGEVITDPVDWPTAEEFSTFYWDEVDDLTPLPDGYTINVSSGTEADPYAIGPLYAEGNLTITGSGVTRLDGTIYVGGNLSFNPTPNITILLNTQTIYAEGSINLQPGCTTSGSGCIIAKGDVNFQPSISGDDFVFLMSIEGMVWLKPGTSFYGSVAGYSEVELMSGTSLNWVELTETPKFPGGGTGGLTIITWQIS